MSGSLRSRMLSSKRQLENGTNQESDEDCLSSSQNSGGSDPLDSPAGSIKRPRILSYREPPPILQSLDSDSFKALIGSPALSDSQHFDFGQNSSQDSDLKDHTTSTCSGNLESLSDIIQQYRGATLNSLKSFEVSSELDFLTNTSLESAELKQNDSSLVGEQSPLLQNVCQSKAEPEPIFRVHVTDPSKLISTQDTQAQDRQKLQQPAACSGCDPKKPTPFSVSVAESSDTGISATSSKPVSRGQRSVSAHTKDTHFDEATDTKPPDSKTFLEYGHEDSHHRDVCSVANTCQVVTADEDPDANEDECLGPLSNETDVKKYQKCSKNQNHLSFHYIQELNVTDLPPEVRHEDSISFLSCLSQLVVQITVYATSAARGPEDSFSRYIDTNVPRYGSGFIASVDDDIRRYRCKRENCPYATFFSDLNHSGSDWADVTPPKSASFNRVDRSLSNTSTTSCSSTGSPTLKHFFYSGVTVRTNKHVIFDKFEADHAHVKFFYNTPEGKEVIHGHVAAIIGVNTNQDHVTLHVMSHDKNLFNTIGLCLEQARTGYQQMLKSTNVIGKCHASQPGHSWVAVISHPHGLAKVISFGRVLQEVLQGTRVLKYYDAPTCPGSSGGLVITPSLLRLQWPGAAHSCTDVDTGYNITFDSRSQDLDRHEIGRIHENLLKYSKGSY